MTLIYSFTSVLRRIVYFLVEKYLFKLCNLKIKGGTLKKHIRTYSIPESKCNT